MATGQYIGVNGVARKVTTPYIGVAGVARKVTAGYVGVDGVARLFFAPDNGVPVILEVEKITSQTYANETTYADEEFVLLDIYPKTNGTVKVTYGGLTKTIKDTSGAEEPNAQSVYFGTLYGVSDSVATPSSGTLTIEGGYRSFAVGIYTKNNKGALMGGGYCSCITKVNDWGQVKQLMPRSFISCNKLTAITIPDEVTVIPSSAFSGCENLATVEMPNEITEIGLGGFTGCKNLVLDSLPRNLVSIGDNAFMGCYSLQFNDNFFGNKLVNIGTYAFSMDQGKDFVSRESMQLTLPSTVTNIGEDAFEGPIIDAYSWNYLKQVTMLSRTPPTLAAKNEYDPFGRAYSGNFKIIVPKGCGDVYKAAAGWSNYASFIVEAS